ncbi:penicillin-binding transpeptidase domain-containing protein [Candidatus Contubernalis alkaliaceticus]|uniref:penicillin-binding transpeptidase domain-containing protein n=1 Tax=Candidatus Contubernalis alkaliaceticus TaxID=338645 RepID=UPI001F4C30C6|nr:penicillin-binding transpeptidase domain-containing protein [Candidatus Contubernalis alkalaceticus]UNC91054.1 penicillin-binding protein 2 [Candidatus Contubernalis alkalaceticus]
MKLLSTRTAVVLIYSLLLVWGLMTFTEKYFNNASVWVQHPSNRHLHADGKLVSSGIIYDRWGSILMQMVEGATEFHKDKTVRTAVMHATGDVNGNVATSCQAAFKDHLTGWDIVNGAYRFNNKLSSGSDLTLTLDADLCAAAYKELDGRKGTVGVYNYKTGEILCMVSTPSFDPGNPPDVKANADKYEGVYINRFLSSAYTPGSVFKLVTAAAAIDNLNNIENNTYYCDGKLQIGGDTVTCQSAHGEVTLKQALANSCNAAFAQITLELGADSLQKYADLAGFNSSLEVDGIKTTAGRVDVEDVTGANLAWAGIGQYTNSANPLNFMAFMGAIANDGVRITPRILADQGIFSFITTSNEQKRVLSVETAEKLKKLMRNNTVSAYGDESFKGLELCAKTGTAEVGGGEKPHAWFAGFLDREDFPLAFVVVIENGGTGRRAAAPVAAKVLQAAVRAGSS